MRMLAFTRRLIELRRKHANLHRSRFFQDRSIRGSEAKDIMWLRPDGHEMAEEEWGQGWVRCLGLMLNGETLGQVDENGEPVKDESFLIIVNCHHDPIDFYLPHPPNEGEWEVLVDTKQEADPEAETDQMRPGGKPLTVSDLSLILLREVKPQPLTLRI